MPVLDSDIEQKLEELREQEVIKPGEYKVLVAYFQCRTLSGTAKLTGRQKRSIAVTLSNLAKKGVLVKETGEPYSLPGDDFEFIAPDPGPVEADVAISDEERAWMLRNYRKYQRNRSEAARILKRSRHDVCRMAIALKLDKRN
ncbi:hypothetical protein [Paenibacillus ihumii]|uniref:hypothetical protein n=1 Tax=Paenibacillus ihumii TaxID=687436 RepID=UPI0006D7AC02|nr:hypothetical protein [Paenibacillus ihumii]